jgi:hypothetical protein
MPIFRIHRMKDSPRHQFRSAPHTIGATQVRPKDFEASGEVEAEGFYDAWNLLKDSERPLAIGDILESAQGELRICKYVGIEEAQWLLPEPAKVEAPTPAVPSVQ